MTNHPNRNKRREYFICGTNLSKAQGTQRAMHTQALRFTESEAKIVGEALGDFLILCSRQDVQEWPSGT